MSRLYDCPGCGKAESSWGDHMCGECERKYHEEQMRMEDQERAEISKAMNACKCEEGCYNCFRGMARLAELDGDFGKAAAIMNQ